MILVFEYFKMITQKFTHQEIEKIEVMSYECHDDDCHYEYEVSRPPVNDDFIQLKKSLKTYIDKDPYRHIPLLVRASFHDLFLQDKAATHGCIMQTQFLKHPENAGLDRTILDLQTIVREEFPSIAFTFGDVIAFAGKVAAETAYPCIKIDFKFNRSPCKQQKPNLGFPATDAFNNTLKELQTTLDYMGSITAEEMAILLAGAHGIKGARATGALGWRGRFSDVNSGKAFIEKTFESTWTFLLANNPFKVASQYYTGDKFDNVTSSTIIRVPSDLLFYPIKVPNDRTKDEGPQVMAIQAKLLDFTEKPRQVFDQEFAKAYSKMLAIGGGNLVYSDSTRLRTCHD